MKENEIIIGSEIWKSQNATSNSVKKGLRKLPLAFTFTKMDIKIINRTIDAK